MLFYLLKLDAMFYDYFSVSETVFIDALLYFYKSYFLYCTRHFSRIRTICNNLVLTYVS